MSTGKKIKIAGLSLLALAFLFFVALIIHIAVMVKGRPPIANATIQMARADFKEPVDSLNAVRIQEKIKALSGVRSTYFNREDHILIYTFDNRQNNARHIYDLAIKNSGFASERHIVSAADAMKGCPVMNDNSFYGKLTAVVDKVVN